MRGWDRNLPEIGSSYSGLKLAFNLAFSYQPRNVFLEARSTRVLSLLFQPDLKVIVDMIWNSFHLVLPQK